MLDRIDSRFAKLWAPVVSALCRITRLSNFMLARIAAALIGVFCLALATASFASTSPDPFILFMAVGYVFSALPSCLSVIRRLEKSFESGSKTFPITNGEALYITVARVAATVMATFDTVGVTLIHKRGLWLGLDVSVALTCYALRDYHPKRPSLIRKAIRWLKAHRPRLHQPSPAPSPA